MADKIKFIDDDSFMVFTSAPLFAPKCNAQPMTRTKLFYSTILLVLLISCSSGNQKADKIKLEDGWYAISCGDQGIKKEFAGDTIVLSGQPIISISDIVSIKSELNTYLDTAEEINFRLTENGNKKWSQLIQNYCKRQIYFSLDDTLINLYTLTTNPENNKVSNFHLTLGYSDFSADKIARIENKITERLKN
jgi:hypothetical protein